MIILLRHGQTFWNRERRVQGRLESDLTPLGERQALAMASAWPPISSAVRTATGGWSPARSAAPGARPRRSRPPPASPSRPTTG
ncbi:histidine phosphatase family protein [Phenylobacterium sp.]|uniref:histidine phosphatase family protein n=1 Tax=Phenylobacterium sp. TaxID=1871053 RepID=UPI00345D2086